MGEKEAGMQPPVSKEHKLRFLMRLPAESCVWIFLTQYLCYIPLHTEEKKNRADSSDTYKYVGRVVT